MMSKGKSKREGRKMPPAARGRSLSLDPAFRFAPCAGVLWWAGLEAGCCPVRVLAGGLEPI